MLRVILKMTILAALGVLFMTVGYGPAKMERRNEYFRNWERTSFQENELSDHETTTQYYHGSVYIHWGSRECNIRHRLVYKGIIGGSGFNGSSAAVNSLCLPLNTLVEKRSSVINSNAQLYVVQLHSSVHAFVACAVCSILRHFSVMIPGERNCSSKGWTKQYEGFLMFGKLNQAYATEHICVDQKLETVSDGALEKYPDWVRLHKAGLRKRSERDASGKFIFCVVCSK